MHQFSQERVKYPSMTACLSKLEIIILDVPNPHTLLLGLAAGNTILFLGTSLGMGIPFKQRPSFASVLSTLTELLATRLLDPAQKRKRAKARTLNSHHSLNTIQINPEVSR